MKIYNNLVMAALIAMTLPINMMAITMRCQSCAEKVAIKQSIKDALAAALAAKEQGNKPDQGDLEKCGCSKPKPKPARDHDSSSSDNAFDDIRKCCKVVHQIKKELKEQGQDAEKCCKRVKHELDEIEELILSQTDDLTACCSTTDALLLSVLDQQTVCCSTTEALLMSQIDQQAICCSVIDSIATVVAAIFACTCT